MDEAGRTEEGTRWAGRPVLSALVLVVAHAVPILAAVATSIACSRLFPDPGSWVGMVGQWVLLFAASTAVLLVVDRGARRLLPLAALLKLSMLFPDKAPKRLSVARRAGSVRNLEARLEEARALGQDDEPTRAAEVILSLVGALHAHDRHTRGHSERVRWFTDLVAEELRLPEADRDRLRWAALLHDIGKLHVHPRILNKPSQLDRREWRHIHRHPEKGAQIAAPLAPWLGEWACTIEQHHERWDGRGYPHGLRGEEIGLGARIVAVADAYEVMTAVRAYKKAASATTARRELTAGAGTQFDPAVVRAFLNISIGRLRWVSGPVAWAAQLPFVGWFPRVAEGAAAMGGQAVGAVGTAAVLSGGTSFLTVADPIVVDEPAPLPIEATVDDGSGGVVSHPVELIGELTPPRPASVRASSSSAGAPVAPPPAPAEPTPSPMPAGAADASPIEEAPGKADERPAEASTPEPSVVASERTDPGPPTTIGVERKVTTDAVTPTVERSGKAIGRG